MGSRKKDRMKKEAGVIRNTRARRKKKAEPTETNPSGQLALIATPTSAII